MKKILSAVFIIFAVLAMAGSASSESTGRLDCITSYFEKVDGVWVQGPCEDDSGWIVTEPPTITLPDNSKYEVKINIVWNSVSKEKATALLAEALAQHNKACKVEVKVKKNGNSEDLYISDRTITSFTILPTDADWDIKIADE